MLRSDLCDFSDAYLVVKGIITITGTNNWNKRNRLFAFKNNAPFIMQKTWQRNIRTNYRNGKKQ